MAAATDPTRQRGQVAGADLRGEQRRGKAVDLDEYHPRDVAPGLGHVVPDDLGHDAGRERVLVGHADQAAEDGLHGAVDEGGDHDGQERVRLVPGGREDDGERDDPQQEPHERHRDQPDR